MRIFSVLVLSISLFSCAYIDEKIAQQVKIRSELKALKLPGIWLSKSDYPKKKLFIGSRGRFEKYLLNCQKVYVNCLLEEKTIEGDITEINGNKLKVFALLTFNYSFESVTWNSKLKKWEMSLDGETFYKDQTE